MALPLLGITRLAGAARGVAGRAGDRAFRLIRLTRNAERRQRVVNLKLRALPRSAHKFFRNTTPIDTGNARRRTRYVSPDTISAEYNYANRLNEGYSRQAKSGMTKPTIEYLRRLIRRI
jgi:hypothetical protein